MLILGWAGRENIWLVYFVFPVLYRLADHLILVTEVFADSQTSTANRQKAHKTDELSQVLVSVQNNTSTGSTDVIA